jgi:menaquinone-9 beta-reductase
VLSAGVTSVLTADVVVVGAGPAGCAAATTLARAGRDVVMIDRARFPRDKTCGDGLTVGALRLLERLGVEPGAVRSWQEVADVVIRAPGGREVTITLPAGQGTFGVVAQRLDLDAELVDVARRAGVEVLDGHGLEAARDGAERIVVTAAGVGEIRARYAIGADGAWSPLRKALGCQVDGYRGEWHAFRQYVGGVSARAQRELWVSFDADLLPGYIWSFPLPDGRANIGFGISRAGRYRVGEMARIWRDVLDRPHVRAVLGPDAEPEASHQAWPIPARVDGIPLTAGRALFVGDAAAATDPMTGEGIGQALQTGMLAAEAILRSGAHDDAATRRRYEASVARDLVADHRMARTVLRALSTPRGADACVRAVGATAWTRRNFARWLFEDYPRALLVTPGRWHRGMFGGTGTYRPA